MLLHFEKHGSNIGLIGQGDVAPHGIRAARNTCHLAQRAASGFEQRRVCTVFIDQRGGERGRDHLRQMTDPGAKLVVFGGIHARDASPNLLHPFQILSAQVVIDLLSRNRSYKPGGALKQIGVRKFDARLFLPGHGMPGKKTNTYALPAGFLRPFQNLYLGAADISKQSFWWQRRSQPIDQVDNSTDRSCENNDLTSPNRVDGVSVAGIDCALTSCTFENRRAIAANDPTSKPVLLQSQCERSANQAGSDN